MSFSWIMQEYGILNRIICVKYTCQNIFHTDINKYVCAHNMFLFGNPFVATEVAAIHPGVHSLYEYIIKSALSYYYYFSTEMTFIRISLIKGTLIVSVTY